MNSSDYNILELIPQRPPFVMIDQLTYSDERSAKGRLFIKESNVLCHNGYLQEAGLMECIAQTAAAFTGYRNKIRNQKISEGYIGAVKNLVIYELPPVGAMIRSEITIENEIVGYTIITGRIMMEQKLLALCEMRILIKGTRD